MHQTTVRFGADLWDEIELEAGRAGVSVAQYVRDAALMRVSYTRGRDGDSHYQAALELIAASHGDGDSKKQSAAARNRARVTVQEALALVSENGQALGDARDLRTDASDRRSRRTAARRGG